MLKTVNKEQIFCAVVFYEEIIAVFMLKISQIGTEIDKKTQIFQCFYAGFVKLSIDFVD